MTTWTDDRVELLKKLWIEGLSASDIRDEIGATSRNSVIGKVKRLGLPGRVQATSQPKKIEKPPKPSRIGAGIFSGYIPARRPPEKNSRKKVYAPVMSNPFSIFDVKDGPYQCRWPLNEVSPVSEFRFCGAPVMPSNPPPGVSKCPYCDAHYRRSIARGVAVESDREAA